MLSYYLPLFCSVLFCFVLLFCSVLDWIGLDWIGLDWIAFLCIGLHFFALDCIVLYSCCSHLFCYLYFTSLILIFSSDLSGFCDGYCNLYSSHYLHHFRYCCTYMSSVLYSWLNNFCIMIWTFLSCDVIHCTMLCCVSSPHTHGNRPNDHIRSSRWSSSLPSSQSVPS